MGMRKHHSDPGELFRRCVLPQGPQATGHVAIRGLDAYSTLIKNYFGFRNLNAK